MRLTFSPIRMDSALAVSADGNVLTINGAVLDFTPLPTGATLPRTAIACDLIAGDVIRDATGLLTVPLILPHGEDAAEDVRFPQPVMLTDGPCTAPGLIEYDGPLSDGVIDWDHVVTAADAETAARAAWRTGRVIPKLDLVLAMAGVGMVSQQSAIAAAAGAIPAELEPLIAAMPDPPQTEVRIRWAGAQETPRLSPFILFVQDAMGLTDEQVDALFGWQ